MDNNIIFNKGGKLEKRKGHQFQEATMHDRVVILLQPEFVIYELYETWYLKNL